jgi:hypothetical protein
LVVLVLLACCGGEAPPVEASSQEHFDGDWSPPPAEDAEVVATVNGARIYAGDIVRQARAEKQTAEQALHTLIDAELLAQEARRRGLTDAPEVVDARKSVRVRRFAEKVFLTSFQSPADVPGEMVERAYALPSARSYYDHLEWRTLSWTRIPVDAKAPPEADRRARALAQGFADLARAAKVKTTAELDALGRLYARTQSGEFATALAGPAVPEFARAAFDLRAPGDVSDPVRTSWGWDVLLLLSINPERHVTREEALADIRKRLFEDARRDAFEHWADAFVAKARVVRNTSDEMLERISTGPGF